jgi:hypothetical protein
MRRAGTREVGAVHPKARAIESPTLTSQDDFRGCA